MNSGREESMAELHHALNNLFTKIMGAADLALHEPCEPAVGKELEVILGLAREGGTLIEQLNPTPWPR
jgi:hypothetical protein